MITTVLDPEGREVEYPEDQIAAIRARIAEAAERETAAMLDKHRAEADLAAAEGREWDREYHEAYVAAQSHQPGGHERFWRHVRRRDAERVIAGEAQITDFATYEREALAAEVERLKAERYARMADD